MKCIFSKSFRGKQAIVIDLIKKIYRTGVRVLKHLVFVRQNINCYFFRMF